MLLNRIFHNCGLKLVSLVLAVALSIYVSNYSSIPFTDSMELPLKIIGLSENLVVNMEASRIPEKIRLEIRGPNKSISRARNGQHSVSIDLADNEAGTYSPLVVPPELEDLTVIDYSPKSVKVVVEPIAEKTLNIEVERLGNVRDEFEISSEDVSPSSVTFSGPASIVERITRCIIDPRIQDLADKDVQDIVVKFVDNEDRPVNTDSLRIIPEAVRYLIDVIPTDSQRVLEVSPHIVGEVADGFRLGTSKPVPLYVTAPSDSVPEGVYYVRTSRIDVSELQQTQIFKGLDIIYPFELRPNSSLPLICDVSVEVRPITEGERLVDIELVNRHEDMDYNISPERLVVKSEELAELTEQELASKIRAWIDVSSMEPGQIKRIPQVDLPVTLQHVTLDRMVVTISINRKDAE